MRITMLFLALSACAGVPAPTDPYSGEPVGISEGEMRGVRIGPWDSGHCYTWTICDGYTCCFSAVCDDGWTETQCCPSVGECTTY